MHTSHRLDAICTAARVRLDNVCYKSFNFVKIFVKFVVIIILNSCVIIVLIRYSPCDRHILLFVKESTEISFVQDREPTEKLGYYETSHSVRAFPRLWVSHVQAFSQYVLQGANPIGLGIVSLAAQLFVRGPSIPPEHPLN